MIAFLAAHDLLLVAVILFAVAAVVRVFMTPRSIDGALVAAGLALFAWAFLVAT